MSSFNFLKTLVLVFSLTLMQLPRLAISHASEAETTYLLLNVITEGPMTVRELSFTHSRSGEEIRIRDIQSINGRGDARYHLQEILPGRYYLSGIYPAINRTTNAAKIDVDKSSGLIRILEGKINYIGDIVVNSDETSLNVIDITDFAYQPNSATLIAASRSEPALFKALDVVVSIADAKPVPVSKDLLGL